MLRILLICLALSLLATPALAADARAHLTIEIAADGYVSIQQQWDGIHALQHLSYDTGTKELGVLDAPVHEGHAELRYASAELLRCDGDRLRLKIAPLDYLGNWLDFDVSLRYPAALEYLNAEPEPSFQSREAHGLMWSLLDRRELELEVVLRGELESGSTRAGQSSVTTEKELEQRSERDAELRREQQQEEQQPRDPSGNAGSAARQQPSAGNNPPDASTGRQPDKRSESGNGQQELLIDGDPLLLEFRMLINAARREGKADEDFLQALEKLLTKFYYLLDAMDATDEYEP
ncbi:hypothetical protein KDL44_13685 [bacterium]|nr:hypothetical protein [bacterium]